MIDDDAPPSLDLQAEVRADAKRAGLAYIERRMGKKPWLRGVKAAAAKRKVEKSELSTC